MKDSTILIVGLLIIALLSLYVDASITIAIVSGLIGYLVPKHSKHTDDGSDDVDDSY